MEPPSGWVLAPNVLAAGFVASWITIVLRILESVLLVEVARLLGAGRHLGAGSEPGAGRAAEPWELAGCFSSIEAAKAAAFSPRRRALSRSARLAGCRSDASSASICRIFTVMALPSRAHALTALFTAASSSSVSYTHLTLPTILLV